MGGNITNRVNSRLNKIVVEIEDLGKDANFGTASLLHKFINLLIELSGSNVFISICSGIELKALVMQFDHDLSNCSFGERVGFLFLNCHELFL